MLKYRLKNLSKTRLSLDIILNNGKLEGCHIGARHTTNNKSRIITEQELKNTPEIERFASDGLLRIVRVEEDDNLIIVDEKDTEPKQGNSHKGSATNSVTKKPNDDKSKE